MPPAREQRPLYPPRTWSVARPCLAPLACCYGVTMRLGGPCNESLSACNGRRCSSRASGTAATNRTATRDASRSEWLSVSDTDNAGKTPAKWGVSASHAPVSGGRLAFFWRYGQRLQTGSRHGQAGPARRTLWTMRLRQANAPATGQSRTRNLRVSFALRQISARGRAPPRDRVACRTCGGQGVRPARS
jgi:hypothetical protein